MVFNPKTDSVRGSIPYVTKTEIATEFVSDFIPLGFKVGEFLLNLGDGAYYIGVAGTGANANKTVLNYDSAQAALVAYDKPSAFIDELSPFSAIPDLIPAITWDANGLMSGVSYTDNRDNPAKGFDYKKYGEALTAAVKTLAGSWASAANGWDSANPAPANPTAAQTEEHDKKRVQAYIAAGGLLVDLIKGNAALNTATPDIKIIDRGASQTAYEQWVKDGRIGNFEEVLKDGDLTDLMYDRVSLDAQGVPFASDLSDNGQQIQPVLGPLDYLVTSDGKTRLGDFDIDAFPGIKDALGKAADDAAKVKILSVFIPASTQEQLTATGVIKDVVTFDKTPWPATKTVTFGGTKATWDGVKWVIVP